VEGLYQAEDSVGTPRCYLSISKAERQDIQHQRIENRKPLSHGVLPLIPSGVGGRGDFPKGWALHTAESAQPKIPAPRLCLPSSSARVPLQCQKTCIWDERSRLLLQGTVDGTHKIPFAHSERQCLLELKLV